MATIDEVARFAGVSVATVSRVINNADTVKPVTADKVRKAIDELRYIPNISARNLRRNESMTVSVMVPNITNPYYAHIFAGICDTAQELGYSAFLYNTGGAVIDRATVKHVFRKNHADGLITLTCDMDSSFLNGLEERFPIVQCCEYAYGSTLPHVAIDNYAAARQIVELLIEKGHRRVAIMKADNRHISTEERIRGYRDALSEHGIEYRPEYVAAASADYSFASGLKATQTLLDLPEPPTAVYCISDILALSAITAAKERRLKVPGDISVAGMDDVDYTTMFHPYLTTVRQPCYDIGRTGMQMLYQFMHDFPAKPESVFMAHEIITRESTADHRG